MISRTGLIWITSKALYWTVLLAIAQGATAWDTGNTANCWAQQTVTVGVSDNLQTLVNAHPGATTFSLAPGIHRLQSVVPQSYDTFVGQPGAVLSGAALLTNFTPVDYYWTSHVQVTQAASYPGQCGPTQPACIYPEDLFFDNIPKYRVASLAGVGPGTWYLDYSSGTVYIGDDPWGHTVEISLLGHAFTGGATAVTISNLIIEKYACPAQSGAVDGAAGSTYWNIGGSEIRFNHGRGVSSGDGMYVHRNNIHNNGQMGIGGGGANIVLQNNEISYNNTSGYSYYWEAGGAKFSNVQNLVLEYNYAHDNVGPGFWNDINSQDVTYESRTKPARNVGGGNSLRKSVPT